MTVVAVMAFVRQFFNSRFLPSDLTGLAVQAQDDEPEERVGKLDTELPLGLVFRFRRFLVNDNRVDGRRDEDIVLPDNG